MARRTRYLPRPKITPVLPLTAEELAKPDPWEQERDALVANARVAPLELGETIVRLAELLKHDLNYQAYRKRNGQYTTYDPFLERSMEAVASAIVHLEKASKP